jgi:hypothetical protein
VIDADWVRPYMAYGSRPLPGRTVARRQPLVKSGWPGCLKGMVDQTLHSLYKLDRARQFGVPVKRRFLNPARMEVKEARISTRDKYVDSETTSFVAHARSLISQDPWRLAFFTVSNMEAGKDEQLHEASIPEWLQTMDSSDLTIHIPWFLSLR